jgi:hypothetical protein
MLRQLVSFRSSGHNNLATQNIFGEDLLRHAFIALFLATAPATALQAQAMPVSTFLAKADALKKRGPLALLSSDLGALKKEVQNSAAELRTERLAAKAAGRKPAFCPPEAGGSLSSDELLSHFQSIPPAQRGMSVKMGLAGLMRKRYPCPA